MYKQRFTMGEDSPEIWCLMEVSTMFYFAHTAFLLGTADLR